jgi:nucleotide-binding universal stress UspA family protein
MKTIRSILHPTDMADPAHAALHLAAGFARDYEAKFTVLYVYPPPVNGADAVDRDRDNEYETIWLDKLKAYTAAVSDAPMTLLVVEGDPAPVIVEEARKYDLVVVGTHGRSGLEVAIVGSVAARVLRESPCPVLTVKAFH